MKLGRLAPHPETTHPRLHLDQFVTTAYPPAPATVDYLSQVESWPMYGNDQIGDCTCAAAGHMVEAWSRYGQGTTATVTDQDVLTAYEAVSGYVPGDPSTDNGAVMQDVLDYWRRTGIGGHKVLAFAQVDHTNLPEVYAALNLFGAIYVGVNFPQSAMDQFNAGQPWSVEPSDGGIIGGHAVNLGWRDHAGLEVVTWGKVQGLDEAWWARYVEEAWVVADPEWVKANQSPPGLDVAALNAAFTAMTGDPGPFPAAPSPTPTPTPVPPAPPTPVVDSADEALAPVAHRWVAEHHTSLGGNHHMAVALQAWLAAKGL